MAMQSDGRDGARDDVPRGPDPSGLPAVGRVLESREMRELAARHGERLVTDLLREKIDEIRGALVRGELTAASLERVSSTASLAAAVGRAAEALLAPSPQRVVNATGVVVHTNLGRATLPEAAAGRLAEASTRYMTLEYDLATGRRGRRGSHLEALAARLFPGHGFLAVNNNAAAILLALRTLARGREVIVSRGELVEIGGAFRVPDILAASGARLREVGTTNRTRVADYEQALGPKTGALLKVHTSNFKIVGFTEEAPVRDLAELARRAGVPLIVDWGSGDVVDLAAVGIHDEVPVGRLLGDGADLVTFSGDKLLGGPQAGLVVGDPGLVKRLARDPMARVVRLDRLLTIALRETLAAYVRGRAFVEIPVLRMLALTAEEIGVRAEALARRIGQATGRGDWIRIEPGVSRTGGGSSPTGEISTTLLVVAPPDTDAAPLERALRRGSPPVIARVAEGRLLVDLRTVFPSEDAIVAERLIEVLAPGRTVRR